MSPSATTASKKTTVTKSRRSSAAAAAAPQSPTTFAELPGLAPSVAAAVTAAFGYERPTAPQAAYLPAALDRGRDVLVKASTGSGKTLGFLLPVVQDLVQSNAAATRSAPPSARPIRALILSPSRELAEQTRDQALRLTAALRPPVGVQMVIGGVGIGGDRRALSERACDVLVATPGRLIDHLETTPGFAARLGGGRLRTLVLDEADRLLDQGFEPALNKIAAAIGPAEDRQLLLFTATVADGVRRVAERLARGRRVEYVDTSALAGQAAKPDIRHETRVVPVAGLVAELHAAICRARAADPAKHKVIVFVPTAKAAEFFSNLFSRRGASRSGVGARPPTAAAADRRPPVTGRGEQKLDQNATGTRGGPGGIRGGSGGSAGGAAGTRGGPGGAQL